METSAPSSEDQYLNDLDQKLVFSNKTVKIERLPNTMELRTLKITRNPSEWSSTSLLKYSPPVFTLVSLTGSSLSIVTLTHNEETVEEVDFKVDLNQAPDEALVDFVSNSLGRQVRLCPGLEEESLLLSSLQCSQVLIERFGVSIRVRSRCCARTVDSAGEAVCAECSAVSSAASVKRELVESWPDIPDSFAESQDAFEDGGYDKEEEEEEGGKEEIKKIPLYVEKKKRGRKAKKKEDSEEDDEDQDEEWSHNENLQRRPNKKASSLFPCPETECPASFTKEVTLVSHLLQRHPGRHTKAVEGWVKCSEQGCFHSYKEGVPHYTKHLINHLKKCHPDHPLLLAETGQKNECTYCGKTFKYNYSLKKHVETLHEAPIVPCHICGILLKGQKTLATHVKSVHDKAVRHHCPEPGCTMTAVNSHHLKDHIAVVHRGQARYVCSVCGKEHGYYKALKHCQDRHKGRYMHPCTLCDKKYLDKVKLTVHMRVHTGEKPYACPICATRMARLDNLSAHIKKTHGVTWQEAEKMTNTSVKGGALQKVTQEGM